MGAIIDTLLLDRIDVPLLRNRYPDCVLTNQTRTEHRVQQYRLIIPDADEYVDNYYNFLLDNLIAMCSRNFRARFDHDEMFKARMRARADANLRTLETRREAQDIEIANTAVEAL